MVLLIVSFLFLSIAAHGSYSSDQRVMGLEDAKKFAIENNFEIRGLREELSGADSDVTKGRSLFYPRLGIVGGIDTLSAKTGTETAPVSFATLNYNIFNGFADFHESRKLEFERDAIEAKLNRSTFELGLNVERLFYNFILKRREREIFEDALALNEKNKANIQKRRASGMLSDADVMQFELRESHLKSELSGVKQDMIEAQLSLLRALGPSVGKDVQPVGDLFHYHLTGALEEYIKQISEKSYLVKEYSALLTAADMEKSTSRSGWLPKIDLEFQGGNLPLGDRPEGGGLAFKGAILAKWELFSGFETNAQMSKAQSHFNRADFELQKQLLDSMTALEVSFHKLESIQERVDIESQNELRAKKLYDAVVFEYKRGIKNALDIVSAEETYLDSRLRREKLKYEFLITKIDLEKTIGVSATLKAHEDANKQERNKVGK